ncbi:MAG: hypothetical protein ACOX3V_03025 [Bacillota bacterium]|jgi:hypothetical protein
MVYDIKVLSREAYADIIATYEMLNTSQDDASMLVALVANNPSTKAQVRLDGQEVGLLRTLLEQSQFSL